MILIHESYLWSKPSLQIIVPILYQKPDCQQPILYRGICDRGIKSFLHLTVSLYKSNMFPTSMAINSEHPFTQELMIGSWVNVSSRAATRTYPIFLFKWCVSLQNGVQMDHQEQNKTNEARRHCEKWPNAKTEV